MKYPEIKVKVDLFCKSGNVLTILGKVLDALKANGVPQSECDQFYAEAISGGYNNVLRVCKEWVDFKSPGFAPPGETRGYLFSAKESTIKFATEDERDGMVLMITRLINTRDDWLNHIELIPGVLEFCYAFQRWGRITVCAGSLVCKSMVYGRYHAQPIFGFALKRPSDDYDPWIGRRVAAREMLKIGEPGWRQTDTIKKLFDLHDGRYFASIMDILREKTYCGVDVILWRRIGRRLYSEIRYELSRKEKLNGLCNHD